MSKDKLAVGYTDTEKIGIWRSRALNIRIYRLKFPRSVGDSSFSFCLALRVAARRSGLSNRSSCFFPWWDHGSNSFIVSSRSHGFGSCLMFTFTLTPMHRGEKRAESNSEERKLDTRHGFGVGSFRPICNNRSIATPSSEPLFLLYMHT